jgi:phthiocerol/phenolphthiocerol synthesis type-I polyketide synthase B
VTSARNQRAGDIAIVGLSIEVPRARDRHAFWELIRAGRNLTGPFPAARRDDVEEYVRYRYTASVIDSGETAMTFHPGSYLDRIDTFDHDFFGLTPRQAATTDPHQRLLLRNTYLALEDAGYPGERIAGTRTGVFVGYGATGGWTYLEYLLRIDPSQTQVGLTGNMVTMWANRLSYLFDLRGPSFMLDTACSSSLVALHQARSALLLGECDTAIVAGARVLMAPLDHASTRLGIESSDGVTRSLDEAADGAGFGEGAGAVVLKRLEEAVADGDQVYAVIKGSAVNHDGRSEAIFAPDSPSQARLLRAAWADAGIDPAGLGYLELHGTATPIGDPIEIEGLRQAFAGSTDDRQFCAVGSVKANLGHLYESAGIISLIKAALTLHHREIPPLANYTNPNPTLDLTEGPVYVPTRAQEWVAGAGPRRSGVSAFGMGGTNAHTVLEEFPPTAPTTADDDRAYLFTLSAHSRPSLRRSVEAYLTYLGDGRITGPVRDVCYTSNISRSAHRHRIALAVESLDDLRTQLAGVDLDAATTPAGPAEPGDMATLAEAYLAGTASGSALLAQYGDDRPRTVGLPPYAFDETRSWVDFPLNWRERFAPGVAPVRHPVLHEARLEPGEPTTGTAAPVRVLALVDPATGAGATLSSLLPAGSRVLELGSADGGFEVEEADLERIADEVVDEDRTHLVHALAFEPSVAADAAELDRRIRKNLTSLFLLGKAVMSAGGRLDLVILTRTGHAVEPGEAGVVPEHALLAGLAKGIAREYPYLTVRVLDVDDEVPAEILRGEMLSGPAGLSALRGERVWRETFAELAEPVAVRDAYLRPGGTYLITGGLGGLGLEVAAHLAALEPDIDLVLLSRSSVPDPEEWDRTVAAEPDGRAARRIRGLRRITELGARVHPVVADVADEDRLGTALARLRERFGRLDGVVHAAGLPGDKPITFTEADAFESVLRPKVRGAFLLDRLTRADRLDFVLHFSSVSAVFPLPGQADYGAANFYLDALAQANPDPGRHVLAIDWVSWRDTGMAVDTGMNEDGIFRSMPTGAGLALMDAGLRSDRRRFFAGEVNYGSELMHILTGYDIDLAPAVAEKIELAMAGLKERARAATERLRAAVAEIDVVLVGRPDAGYTDLELMAARCLSHAFGFREIHVEADFRDLGADSVTALTFANNLGACLDVPFDPADLITERSIAGVARLIESRAGDGMDDGFDTDDVDADDFDADGFDADGFDTEDDFDDDLAPSR